MYDSIEISKSAMVSALDLINSIIVYMYVIVYVTVDVCVCVCIYGHHHYHDVIVNIVVVIVIIIIMMNRTHTPLFLMQLPLLSVMQREEAPGTDLSVCCPDTRWDMTETSYDHLVAGK